MSNPIHCTGFVFGEVKKMCGKWGKKMLSSILFFQHFFQNALELVTFYRIILTFNDPKEGAF